VTKVENAEQKSWPFNTFQVIDSSVIHWAIENEVLFSEFYCWKVNFRLCPLEEKECPYNYQGREDEIPA